MGQLAESRNYGGLRKASPDNETTSQQDNEWGFADNGQQTTDNRIWASLVLRQTTRQRVNKTTRQRVGLRKASPDDYVDL